MENRNEKLGAKEVDVRAYMKYILKKGVISEKRELLVNLQSRLICKNKKLSLIKSV